MQFSIKHIGLTLALWCCASLGLAQDFPNRPVKIIVPYAAGGQPDTLARVLAQSLSIQWNQPVIVENIPGAGAVSAVTALMNAPADGHTLFTADAGHWAINPALRRRQTYDFLRDFTAVRVTHNTSLVLVVNSSLGVSTWQELINLLKSKPGVYSYGTSGIGSVHHLAMEMFKSAFGVDILHVPFKSTSQSFPAALSGQISMALTALGSVSQYTKDPRVKIIGVTTKNRTKLAPHLQALSELGQPDFDYGGGGAMIVRNGTPRAIVDKLAVALDKAFATPEVVQRMNATEIEFVPVSTPEAALERIRGDIPRYLNAVKVANATSNE